MPRRGIWAAFCISFVLTAKTHTVDGVVVALDPASQTILVSHRPIGRYMPAMMMPFRVVDVAQLAGLHPGSRVQFDLVVERGTSFARKVRKAGGADVEIPPPKERLAIGQPVADFALTDQQGATVRLSNFRGEVVAVDFIYTRCPLPDVCPRLSANFAAMQHRFEKELSRDLVLLSVTVDPDYDTPALLAEYARRWGADGQGWHFLTGDVSALAAQLGEVYWTDEGSIGHNSTTSVIGRDGRLAAMVEGSGYLVDQLAHLIERALEEAR